MFERLQAALLRIGFLNPQNPDHIMFAFRRSSGVRRSTSTKCRILLGLARQIDWYARATAGAASRRRAAHGERIAKRRPSRRRERERGTRRATTSWRRSLRSPIRAPGAAPASASTPRASCRDHLRSISRWSLTSFACGPVEERPVRGPLQAREARRALRVRATGPTSEARARSAEPAAGEVGGRDAGEGVAIARQAKRGWARSLLAGRRACSS